MSLKSFFHISNPRSFWFFLPLLTSVYVGLCAAGLVLQSQYGWVTPLWPAAGFSLALVWVYGWRWCWLIVVGELLVSSWVQQPWVAGVFGGLAELIEVSCAVLLLKGLRVNPRLTSARDLKRFLALALSLPPLLGALIGVTGLAISGTLPIHHFVSATFTWWVGDAMGLLLVTPLFLSAKYHLRWMSKRHLGEGAVFAVVLAATMLALMVTMEDRWHQLFFLYLPLVVYAAYRFGLFGTSLTTAGLAAIVIGFDALQPGASDFDDAIRIMFVGTAAIAGFLLAVTELERRQNSRRLTFSLVHDELTRLPNRTALNTALKHASVATPAGSALIYLDLDQFKIINNTVGHHTGDRLLRELAPQLSSVIPEQGQLFRVGGDEFVVLLTSVSEEMAVRLAEKLRQVILDYRLQYRQSRFGVGVSIGVTFFNGGDEDPSQVLSRADMAVNLAKEDGRNRIHIYGRADQDSQRRHNQLGWIEQLQKAMDANALELMAQPIIDLRAPDQVRGYEILLRLRNASGLIRPGAFIPVAEQYGLIVSLDRWVIKKTLDFLVSNPDFSQRCFINLSGRTLDEPKFAEEMLSLCKDSGVSPDRLCFEVTETVAVKNLPHARRAMQALAREGFHFALDDFGSGVAGFGYLEQLPVDYVKLDGRFVRDLHVNDESRVVIESVARLAHLRKIECIAEWVEREDVVEPLKSMRVDLAQGHLYACPTPLSDFADAA